MDQEALFRLVLTVLIVGILVPLTLWYLGARFHKRQLKLFGVVIAVVYFAALAMDLGQRWFRGFAPDAYRTVIAGPARRATESFVSGETPFPVSDAGKRQMLELLPVARIGEPPAGPLTLRYEVRGPDGEVLARGQETLQPTIGGKWPALHAEFPAREVGEHKLVVDIPKPAGEVRVTIREVRR